MPSHSYRSFLSALCLISPSPPSYILQVQCHLACGCFFQFFFFHVVPTVVRIKMFIRRLIVLGATGKKPQHSKNTLVKVRIVSKLTASQWGAVIDGVEGRVVRMRVMPSSEAIVGRYDVYVELMKRDAAGGLRGHKHAKHPRPLYIIFNAWCKGTPTYKDTLIGIHL